VTPVVTQGRRARRHAVRDPEAAFRLEVVRTLAGYALQPAVTIALVAACAHRPFAECRPQDFVPALEELHALAHAHSRQLTKGEASMTESENTPGATVFGRRGR
jgi:hypothetical protein